MKKYILIVVFVAFAGIAKAQTFKFIDEQWSYAYVQGVYTLSNKDVFVFGNGQFLSAPAPMHGCIIRGGVVLPLPWEIPINTAIVVESTDGIIYIAGSLGMGKIENGVYQKLVETQSFIRGMCLYQNSLYFGGSFASIGGIEGNFARYSISTGELTVMTLMGTVRSVVPFAKAGEDTSLYVLTSEIDSSFYKFDVDLNPRTMTDEGSAPKGYIGREMKIWQGKLVITCWGRYEDGYLGVFDGNGEWEFSHNIRFPTNIAISPNEELYLSGTFVDSTISNVRKFSSLGESTELVDEKGRRVQSTIYSPNIYVAWDDKYQYVITNDDSWVDGFVDHHHFYRLDNEVSPRPSNLVVFPNPSNGTFMVELPNRFFGYITIFDINGKVVYSQLHFGKTINIDLLDVENGTYIIKCGDEYVKKIVILN